MEVKRERQAFLQALHHLRIDSLLVLEGWSGLG